MTNAWTDTTERGMRYDRVDRGFSYGGASLQACLLALLFAAQMEFLRADMQRYAECIRRTGIPIPYMPMWDRVPGIY